MVNDRLSRRAKPVVLAIVVVLCLFYPSPAATATWTIGDVFAGVANGSYQVWNNAGTIKKDTITQPSPNYYTTGCAFNAPQFTSLYTTNFSFSKVVVFDRTDPHPVTQTIDTALQGGGSSESVVFSRIGPTGNRGDFYVGHAGGDRKIQRYNAAGSWQQSYSAQIENMGTDWIDLAADQQTMFYTSEGQKIKRFSMAGTGTQLNDFATLPTLPGIRAFALRLLPPGDGSGGLLVANELDIKRLNGAGIVVQTYNVAPAVGNTRFWFSLSLDPDGVSFWAGDVNSGRFHKFDILLGIVSTTVDTGVGPNKLFGLCALGEPTAAMPAICPANNEDNGNGAVADENGNDGGTFDDDECDNNHLLTHQDPNHNMRFTATGHGGPSFKVTTSGLQATSVGQGLANGKPASYTLVQMGGWPGFYSLMLSDLYSGAVIYQRSGWLISGAINIK